MQTEQVKEYLVRIFDPQIYKALPEAWFQDRVSLAGFLIEEIDVRYNMEVARGPNADRTCKDWFVLLGANTQFAEEEQARRARKKSFMTPLTKMFTLACHVSPDPIVFQVYPKQVMACP